AAPNDAHPRKVRADFLGNDQATPVTEVGTFRCRALHSNHMAGHLYMEYGSDSLRGRGVVADIPEPEALKNGGRGYLRNISLVNVWSTAPFMHNNAIGPEICGKPANRDNDFHRARYVGADGKLLAEQPACLRYDPSVDGRFELYKRSMHELLNPAARGRKVTFTNADLLIDMGIRPLEGKVEKPLGGFGQVKIPMGASAGFLNGLLHKQLIADLYLAKHDPARLEAAGRKALVPTLQAITEEVLKEPKRFVDILREQRDFLSANYVSCDQLVENEGHRFGEDLSDADKKAVTAFLATL
ncbi:MAG: cytochrome c, partial [Planctomycetaceae bacterium]|nr:cytochrome c [Planctomycetaceae bacterium]